MTRTIRSVHVTIPTENGWQLAGTVDLPRDLKLEDAPRRAVVAHCFTCTRGAIGVTRISKALARAGYAGAACRFAQDCQQRGSVVYLPTEVVAILASGLFGYHVRGGVPKLRIA